MKSHYLCGSLRTWQALEAEISALEANGVSEMADGAP